MPFICISTIQEGFRRRLGAGKRIMIISIVHFQQGCFHIRRFPGNGIRPFAIAVWSALCSRKTASGRHPHESCAPESASDRPTDRPADVASTPCCAGWDRRDGRWRGRLILQRLTNHPAIGLAIAKRCHSRRPQHDDPGNIGYLSDGSLDRRDRHHRRPRVKCPARIAGDQHRTERRSGSVPEGFWSLVGA
jgi:hypothetical protein